MSEDNKETHSKNIGKLFYDKEKGSFFGTINGQRVKGYKYQTEDGKQCIIINEVYDVYIFPKTNN